MSANRIFLVCESHPAIEDALCLADRPDATSRYYCVSNCRCLKCKCAEKERTRRNEWFQRHAGCGVDRFRLAFQRTQGWDVSPPAQDTTAGAVRIALATNGANGSGSKQ